MFWREWLTTLLGLTILLAIVEMILPPGDIGKFSRLVLGLVVLLAVLQPLITFLKLNPEIPSISTWVPAQIEQDALVLAEEMRLAGAKPLLEADSGGHIRQLEALLLTMDQIEDVQVEIRGSSFDHQMVLVKIDSITPDLELRVRKIVSGILNIGEHQVAVEPWYD
jgi:stage III sporulation protein AF